MTKLRTTAIALALGLAVALPTVAPSDSVTAAATAHAKPKKPKGSPKKDCANGDGTTSSHGSQVTDPTTGIKIRCVDGEWKLVSPPK